MTADEKSYGGITRQAFGRLSAALERAHVPLPAGDSGTISGKGLTGSFDYDEAHVTLRLRIDKYPMLLPKAMVWGAIDAAIADAKKA